MGRPLAKVALVAACLALMMMVLAGANKQQISIKMPNIRPDRAEQYLCYAHRLENPESTQYIVGFNPQADASRVHHMLVYGCEKPGIHERDSPNEVWDCSEMQMRFGGGGGDATEAGQSFRQGPVCQSRTDHVLYGWAMNAPALKLPKGVGFKVGGPHTHIKYLVLQVHYGHHHVFKRSPSVTDNSGLILDMRPDKPGSGITKQASVLLMISLGQVLPGKSKHQIWCTIDEDIEIHPFRYRVHTHKMGTRVLGARVGARPALIGAGNPQTPQMFHPVEDKFMSIRKGDEIMAQCEFYNNNTYPVSIGQTANDEMCNYYIMYWTESPKLLSKSVCYGQNPKTLFPIMSDYDKYNLMA